MVLVLLVAIELDDKQVDEDLVHPDHEDDIDGGPKAIRVSRKAHEPVPALPEMDGLTDPMRTPPEELLYTEPMLLKARPMLGRRLHQRPWAVQQPQAIAVPART